jgi:hypothetical protein
MTIQQESKLQNPKGLLLSSALGASIPMAWLLIIILTKEDLFESWMYYPLILIPLGGALGGIFFYLMGFHFFPSGKKKLIALIFSSFCYFISVWMSAVLAFAITGLWN